VDDFKLSKDDTMRHLRTIAQTPGELQWRMELLATLDRLRTQHEVAVRGILQTLQRLEKKTVGRAEIAEIANTQIHQHRRDTESVKWRATSKVLWTNLATALFTLLGAYLLYRLTR
jgi:hypothetical protein